jgi:benzylsuccinate CoA-transferase BbsE subunit
VSSPAALDGIRVLDLAGPLGVFGAKMLADLGADVINIEPPEGDELRRRPPFADQRPHPEGSLPFFQNNCNKRGITLNLDTEAGRALFRGLVATADVVIETAAPGWMAARRIAYHDLQDQHPRLIWAAVTPFGQDGPRARWAGTELGLQAMGGALYLTGERDERPVRAGGHVAEKMAGYTAGTAVMFALQWRNRSGRGQFIDVSAQEAIAAQMESFTTKIFYTGSIYSRDGRLYPRTYPAGLFPCADGWVSLVAGPLHQWHALRDWIADERLFEPRFEELDVRMAERPYLDPIICDWTRPQKKYHLFEEGQRRRIPVGVSLTPGEVTRDPHLRERGYVSTLEHPHLGTVEVPGRPYILEKTPWTLRRPAPLLGEHNEEVYAELGLCRNDLSELRQQGVI